MIKKLNIKGFQSHENSLLEFSNGVNIIAGTGDVGKSSIFRSKNWVSRNRPLGEDFINDNMDSCEVSMTVIDNEKETEVTRFRSRKGDNYYKIEGATFEAFGHSVPERVSEILNMDDLNIQWQEDVYFIIYSSPGQIASYVRSLVGLDQIDSVIKRMTSAINRQKEIISELKQDIKTDQTKIEKLKSIGLDEFEKSLQDLQKNTKYEEEIDEEIKTIKLCVHKVEHINLFLFSFEDPTELIDRSRELENQYNETLRKIGIIRPKVYALSKKDIVDIEQSQQLISTSIKLEEEYSKKKSKVDNLSRLISKIKKIRIFSFDVSILEKYPEKDYEETEVLFIRLSGLISRLKSLEIKIQEFKEKEDKAQEEVSNLQKGLDTCPYCERGGMDVSAVDALLRNSQ